MQEALSILKEIDSSGYEAYLVGGAPRDTYLGLEVTDFDICTNATPEELETIFPNLDMRFKHYGNVVLKRKNTYEITTYRKEYSYLKHRRPSKVEYVNSLLEDLQRRDFIINTLCMDKDGNFVDLLGAKKDLDDRIIRTVGDANEKFEEDALRILRAIRFASTLNFALSKEVKEAILQNKQYLNDLSEERKKEELQKISSTKQGNKLLQEFGLF